MKNFYFSRRGLGLVCALLLGLGAGGCAVPGVLAYKFLGPPAIPARYNQPKIPLLILVENAHSGSLAMPETDALAQVIYADLQSNKVAPLIDPDKVHEFRDHHPTTFGKMSIAQIGENLGAQQVLYIQVHQLDIEAPAASDVVRLKISAAIRIVDTAMARTSWPQSGEAESFDVETPWQRIEPGTSRSGLNQEILRESGQEIARWFYAYKPETMKEENKDEKLR
jgi:hypothetical protein